MRGKPENLKPFPKGVSGNPKGRPKNRVNEQLETLLGSRTRARAVRDSGLTKAEAETWENIVFSLPLDLLKAVAQGESTPAYPKGLAIALIGDMKEGTTKTLDKLREWQFGKASQPVDVSGKLEGAQPIAVEIIDRREQVRPDQPEEEGRAE